MSKYYKAEDVIDFLNVYCPKDMWEYQIADLPTIEVSEDCISREVAIDIIKNYDFEFPEYMERFVNELRDAMKKDLVEDIKDALSVLPKRSCYRCGLREDCEDSTERKPKQGEWIDKGYYYAVCSNCGAKSGTQFNGVEPIPRKSKYCHNCGARMKG